MSIGSKEIEDIIALFHITLPLNYKVIEIRNQAKDIRYIVYINYPHKKYVLKMAYNNFTTEKRIEGWVKLIEVYKKLNCYSPSLIKSLNNKYSERIIFKDKPMIVWQEEFALYKFLSDIKNKDLNHDLTRYVFQDELIQFYANVGKAQLTGFPGNSGWSRLKPFMEEDEVDEVSECIETFDEIIRKNIPHFLDRWIGILFKYNKNKEDLKEIYHDLPTSIFQADWNDTNILVDDRGYFKGLIDYNLCGKDTCLNIFISMSLYGGIGWSKSFDEKESKLIKLLKNIQNSRIENMFNVLKEFKKHYNFLEVEVKAAPLLFKYIVFIEYDTIEMLKKYLFDDDKLNQLFDFIEYQLLRNDIDFSSVMSN